MNCWIRMAVGLGISLASYGCLWVPLKEDTVLGGKPVKEEQLAFLTPKVTTKQEVIERLGNPNVIWEDHRVFAYNWVMRQGILFWVLGGFPQAAAGMGEIPKCYIFMIQFDEIDRVVRYEQAERSWTQSYGDFLRQWLAKSNDAKEPDR